MEICMEKSKKRPWESPPQSPPSQLTPTSLPSLRPARNYDFEDAFSESEVLDDLNVDFIYTLYHLVADGIIPDQSSLLRCHESFKQSWEMSLQLPLSYEGLCHMLDCTPTDKEKIEDYLSSALQNKYFDIPKERPSFMLGGFFVLYPEPEVRKQKDPVFQREPNLIKVVPLISKLGTAAVEVHNFLTDSNLSFSKVKKANLMLWYGVQAYFITLEAIDNDLSGKEVVTCRSRVVCRVAYTQRVNIDAEPVPVESTSVESFHRLDSD